MKPITMTPEEEDLIRRDVSMLGREQQRLLLDEIDALRKLPVIARCHDCAHAETSPHADVCVHPAAGGRVEHGGKLPPPGNCPLRGGAR